MKEKTHLLRYHAPNDAVTFCGLNPGRQANHGRPTTIATTIQSTTCKFCCTGLLVQIPGVHKAMALDVLDYIKQRSGL